MSRRRVQVSPEASAAERTSRLTGRRTDVLAFDGAEVWVWSNPYIFVVSDDSVELVGVRPGANYLWRAPVSSQASLLLEVTDFGRREIDPFFARPIRSSLDELARSRRDSLTDQVRDLEACLLDLDVGRFTLAETFYEAMLRFRYPRRPPAEVRVARSSEGSSPDLVSSEAGV